MTILLILFLSFVIAELYVFVWTATEIGVLSSIGLTALTAIGGLFIVRLQGLGVLQQAERTMRSGETPLVPVVHGIGLLMAGLCLALPGFITDALGFLLLIPPVRIALGGYAIKNLKDHFVVIRPDQHRREADRSPDVIDLDETDWERDDDDDPTDHDTPSSSDTRRLAGKP